MLRLFRTSQWMIAYLIFFAAFAIEAQNTFSEEKAVQSSETAPVPPEKKSALLEFLPAQQIAYFDYIFQPSNDIKNIDDTKFDLNEFRMAFEPSFEVAPEIYLGLGIRYSAYYFKFTFEDAKFDPVSGFEDETDYRTLHSLSFPLSLAYIGNEWMVYGEIVTSINSDFRGLDRHDAQVNGGIIVGYLFHPTFFLQLGIFASNDFGDLMAVPAGGFVWKPFPSFDMSILIPFSGEINYHASDNLTLLAYYEMDGNQFRFRYRENGEVLEEDGQFTFFRFGAGCKYYPMPGLGLKLIVGGTSDGRYEFRGLSTDEPAGRMKGTFFLLVGITIDENIFNAR